MSEEVFSVSEEEQKAFEDILNEKEAGPSQPQQNSGSIDPPGLDIPALRELLAVLVTTGKAKEAIGV